METPESVRRAVVLLRERIADARAERDTLTEEIANLEGTLAVLEGLYASVPIIVTGPPTVSGPLPVEKPFALTSGPKVSVRAVVKDILDSHNHAFTAAEVRDLIPADVAAGKSKEQLSSVIRSSLWSFREKGEAISVDGHKTISSRWLQSTEGPSAPTEGPSDGAQLEDRGGEQGSDNPLRNEVQGHDRIEF